MKALALTLFILGFGVFIVGAWLVRPGDPGQIMVGITLTVTVLIGFATVAMFAIRAADTGDVKYEPNAIVELEMAANTTRKELLAIAEDTGREMARLRAENAWMREVLNEIAGDVRLLTAAAEGTNLSPFAVTIISTIGARARNGLLNREGAPPPCAALRSILRDGMSVRLVCQRPIGHDDEHSFTSRGGVTTMWPSRA